MRKIYVLGIFLVFVILTGCVDKTQDEQISIIGQVKSEISVGSPYIELGLIIPDDYVYVVEGEVNTSVVGNYVLTYTVLTTKGELVKKLYRYVDVIDTINPTLTPFEDITFYVGFSYSISDLIDDYSDNYDSKNNLIINYDTSIFTKNTPGIYAFEISITDSSGNKTTLNSTFQVILDMVKLIEHVYEYQTYKISKGTTGIGSSYIRVQIDSNTSFTYYDSGSVHFLKSFTTSLGTRASIQISGGYGNMQNASINYHITGVGTYSVGFIDFDATQDYESLVFTHFNHMINNLNLREQDMINEFNTRALPTLEEFKYYMENMLNLILE